MSTCSNQMRGRLGDWVLIGMYRGCWVCRVEDSLHGGHTYVKYVKFNSGKVSLKYANITRITRGSISSTSANDGGTSTYFSGRELLMDLIFYPHGNIEQ